MKASRWLPPLLIGGSFVAIAILESGRPLRRRRELKSVRLGRNLAMAGLSALATSLLQRPLLEPVVRKIEDERLGFMQQVRMPQWLRLAAGVLSLDYTLWWWHFANHRSRFLWRFHLVHHVDRDLDASTALRFHFGEMSLSVFFRMLQVRILGVDRRAMSVWQTMLLISIFFHHSNLRLPLLTEHALVRWFVTPRMHGIHHSTFRDETDSNWSSLLSFWDRLHGTMRLDVPQPAIEIGVPAYQRAEDVTIEKITTLPFREQADDWTTPSGVRQISRTAPKPQGETLLDR